MPSPLHLTDAPRVPINIDGRIMYSSAETEIIHLRLMPGEVLPKHDNPVDVVFYVLSGTGMISYDDKILEMRQDHCLELSSAIERQWENTGEEPLRILVIKKMKKSAS